MERLHRAMDDQRFVLLCLTILWVVLFQLIRLSLIEASMAMKCILLTFIAIPVAVRMIFQYGNYRCTRSHIKDPLEMPLSRHIPWFDGWSYSHLICSFAVGKLLNSPILVAYFFVILCLWEVFESYLGTVRPAWVQDIGGCTISTDKDEDEIWWYGKYTDIIVNTTGLLLSQVI